MSIQLYDYVISGNCYKVRLLLGFLGLDHEAIPVDFFPGREHKSASFLEINPLGQLPVLEDDGTRIRDAQAILIYLANKYDAEKSWWPANDGERIGQVAQWLAFADQLTATAGAARLHAMLAIDLNIEEARRRGNGLLRVLEDHLSEREYDDAIWIVGDTPTIADIACFPYTALAEDGGIDLTRFPAIRRWIRNFTKIPGFRNMPGINDLQ